ncbi:MAG TPA: alpha/beta hydrolase-fold protein [bacterium]|nr:alpha/beta hydrolase-fold protein [bacterium]
MTVREAASPKIKALAEAIDKARPKNRARIISDFLGRNRYQFPLVEDSLVTFVYCGKVTSKVCVPSDLNRWDTNGDQLAQLDEADFYWRTLALPTDARIDYKFYVDNVWILDPLNPKTVRGGFGDNSSFAMPAYQEPQEIAEVKSIQHGTIVAHQFASKVLGNTRRIQVYLPAGYQPMGVAGAESSPGGPGNQGANADLGFAGSYRAIFVQDGGEYMTLGSMVNVLDNLIASRAIPPVVGIFIDPVDRNSEYRLNPAYESMIMDEVLPFIRGKYDVARDPAKTAIMGASLGGEISAMIALDHPEVFGRCGSQSGVMGLDDAKLINAVRTGPRKAIDFYLDCGRFGDVIDENRQMQDALNARGYLLKYQEFNEGHSWGNWRAHLDDVLIFFWGSNGTK